MLKLTLLAHDTLHAAGVSVPRVIDFNFVIENNKNSMNKRIPVRYLGKSKFISLRKCL